MVSWIHILHDTPTMIQFVYSRNVSLGRLRLYLQGEETGDTRYVEFQDGEVGELSNRDRY